MKSAVRWILGLTALVLAFSASAEDRLPQFFDARAGAGASHEKIALRPWTFTDLVEVRRITGTAISDKTCQVAMVIKQSFVDSDDIRYGLYVTEREGRRATKVLEAAYLDQLSWHPNTESWTVRGDFGSGIQLYDVDSTGHEHALVLNPNTIVVGAAESVIIGDVRQGPRATGVASYEWSPDGTSLWYSTYRLRGPADRSAMAQHGIVYDEEQMYVHAFFNDPTLVLGAELHVLRPDTHLDRLVAFVPGGYRAGDAFTRDSGTLWEKDSLHIQYHLWLSTADKPADFSRWSVNVDSGESHKLPIPTIHSLSHSILSPDGRGYLTVETNGDSRRLVQERDDGTILKDFGKVDFNDVGNESRPGVWFDPNKRRLLVGARYGDHQGIVAISRSGRISELPVGGDNLSLCTFTHDATYGICVRESVTVAPYVMELWTKTGRSAVLIKPNTRYSELLPLHVEPAEWTNRFGYRSDGYITYPRDYRKGIRYPTIVVTHGRGARNEFFNDGFLWEFPIQALAEAGYAVLSLNEPRLTADLRAGQYARLGIETGKSVYDIQFSEAFNPVASMEDALKSSIERGLTDPSKTGIAGYSRGAEIVEWVMTQSHLFHAAVEGDAGGFVAGTYVQSGPGIRAYYRQLYGGSPYDPVALENHQRLSASFRTKQFSGPLLQLFSKTNGFAGLELHSLLRDAGIPTELVFYPTENHVFWDPRDRVSSMRRTMDWFDYWLRSKRNVEQDVREQYDRWDKMSAIWRNHNGEGTVR